MVPESLRRSAPCRSRHQRVAGQQNGRRGIDGHRRGDLFQRNPVEQPLHVGQRGNRHTDAADFARRQGMVANRGPSGWAGRRPPRGRWCPAKADSGSGGCFPRRCRIRHTAAWSRAGCDTCPDRCRGYTGIRPGRAQLGRLMIGRFCAPAGSEVTPKYSISSVTKPVPRKRHKISVIPRRAACPWPVRATAPEPKRSRSTRKESR